MQIIASLAGAQSTSDLVKINKRHSRWATQSYTDLFWYWELRFILLQIPSTKALESPKFLWKKLLNSSQVIDLSPLI